MSDPNEDGGSGVQDFHGTSKYNDIGLKNPFFRGNPNDPNPENPNNININYGNSSSVGGIGVLLGFLFIKFPIPMTILTGWLLSCCLLAIWPYQSIGMAAGLTIGAILYLIYRSYANQRKSSTSSMHWLARISFMGVGAIMGWFVGGSVGGRIDQQRERDNKEYELLSKVPDYVKGSARTIDVNQIAYISSKNTPYLIIGSTDWGLLTIPKIGGDDIGCGYQIGIVKKENSRVKAIYESTQYIELPAESVSIERPLTCSNLKDSKAITDNFSSIVESEKRKAIRELIN